MGGGGTSLATSRRKRWDRPARRASAASLNFSFANRALRPDGRTAPAVAQPGDLPRLRRRILWARLPHVRIRREARGRDALAGQNVVSRVAYEAMLMMALGPMFELDGNPVTNAKAEMRRAFDFVAACCD